MNPCAISSLMPWSFSQRQTGSGANVNLIPPSSPDDAPALVDSLAEERIVCSLRETNLRVAAHFYNTAADIDVLLEALSRRRDLLAV